MIVKGKSVCDVLELMDCKRKKKRAFVVLQETATSQRDLKMGR